MNIKKAYPNVCRSRCLRTLERFSRMLNIIDALHGTTLYRVHTKTDITDPFTLARGLREGCPSSCVIFNLYPEISLRQLESKVRGTLLSYSDATIVPGSRRDSGGARASNDRSLATLCLKLLAFADDTVIISRYNQYEQDETTAVQAMKELSGICTPW